MHNPITLASHKSVIIRKLVVIYNHEYYLLLFRTNPTYNGTFYWRKYTWANKVHEQKKHTVYISDVHFEIHTICISKIEHEHSNYKSTYRNDEYSYLF